VKFLLSSQRTDGSWAIDTNLATWVTTLAMNAVARPLPRIGQWLLQQQYRAIHPYTQAAPGGWAWTNLPGGVPDADDTAGAVLALRKFWIAKPEIPAPETCSSNIETCEILRAVRAGIRWLVDLQNRDGGIPTFCRGWGALPFDRSSPDITAHAIRCWLAWLEDLPLSETRRVGKALHQAVGFLAATQRRDGAWVPLWFGNQFTAGEENLTYGTARVVCALAEVIPLPGVWVSAAKQAYAKGVRWLINAQNPDGGWGGAAGVVSSVEETGLALEALAVAKGGNLTMTDDLLGHSGHAQLTAALERGLEWLLGRVESGDWLRPSPIGFYFAKLWYYERLYPQIFATLALKHLAS
jgi:squalene-hopene/tetraprenyl-beta-curcumene cyclase